MAWVHATNDASAATITVAATYAAADAVAGFVFWEGTTLNLTGGTVTDGTNTYTIIEAIQDANGICIGSFVAQNVAAGTPTVSVNFTTTVPFRRLFVGNYASMATTGQPNAHKINQQSNPGTGADAITSTTATTTINGCKIIGFHETSSFQSPAIAAGTSFASVDSLNGAAGDNELVEDRVQATSGSVAATATDSTHGGAAVYASAMLAFAPGAGGGPTGNFTLMGQVCI